MRAQNHWPAPYEEKLKSYIVNANNKCQIIFTNYVWPLPEAPQIFWNILSYVCLVFISSLSLVIRSMRDPFESKLQALHSLRTVETFWNTENEKSSKTLIHNAT